MFLLHSGSTRVRVPSKVQRTCTKYIRIRKYESTKVPSYNVLSTNVIIFVLPEVGSTFVLSYNVQFVHVQRGTGVLSYESTKVLPYLRTEYV